MVLETYYSIIVERILRLGDLELKNIILCVVFSSILFHGCGDAQSTQKSDNTVAVKNDNKLNVKAINMPALPLTNASNPTEDVKNILN